MQDQQQLSSTARGTLPHPVVVIAALMLALAGVWCLMAGQADDDSDVAMSMLREQVARTKTQYLSVSRLATSTRTRLLETQDQLQRFTTEQYRALQRAAMAPLADMAPENPAEEPLELTEATADRIEAERLKSRLVELGQERGRLLERFTLEHPQVRDVELQIADAQRQIDAVTPGIETIPAPPAMLAQNDHQAEQNLRRAWTSLVDGAIAGGQLLDEECRQVQQQLVSIEAQRAIAEKHYLASSDALASGAQAARADTSRSKDWAMILFGCAVGLPLLAMAGRIAATPGVTFDPLIREASEIERYFRLPVTGWVGMAGAGLATATPRGRAPLRWSLLAVQLIAAVIVFLTVAMTIQNPQWLAQVPSDPIEAFRTAAGNLGG